MCRVCARAVDDVFNGGGVQFNDLTNFRNERCVDEREQGSRTQNQKGWGEGGEVEGGHSPFWPQSLAPAVMLTNRHGAVVSTILSRQPSNFGGI